MKIMINGFINKVAYSNNKNHMIEGFETPFITFRLFNSSSQTTNVYASLKIDRRVLPAEHIINPVASLTDRWVQCEVLVDDLFIDTKSKCIIGEIESMEFVQA